MALIRLAYQQTPPKNPEVKRIVIIGDSITFGFGSAEGMSSEKYFDTLLEQSFLYKESEPPAEFFVNGRGYRGIIRKGFEKQSFMNETEQYKVAVLDSNADVFVIMLGSNDGKNNSGWDPHAFFYDYLDFCRNLTSLPQRPKVYLVSPPPYYPQFKHPQVPLNASVVNEQIPYLTEHVARKCGLPDDQFIDVFEAMGGADLQSPLLFCDPKVNLVLDKQKCDGFHPNKVGRIQIAQEILHSIFEDETSEL